jgi:hypothetical protein
MIRKAVETWAADPNSGFAAASQVRAGQTAEYDRLAADLADEQRGWDRVAKGWRSHSPEAWAELVAEHEAVVARIGGLLAGLRDVLAEPPTPPDVRWGKRTGTERRALAARALQVPILVTPGRGNTLTPDQRIKLRVRGRV